MIINKYKPIIGLEIHTELATERKMFCGCPADHFGKAANTQVCPVCLGLPGALPKANRKAIEWTVMIGLALNCKINISSKFDRKHYFYPDLPKGYQISQYDQPLCVNGYLETNEGKVRISRVHLEEDTGKLQHRGKKSLVDFNRSGVPLVEIVTEPDIRSAAQAREFAQKLQSIVRYLNVSDCDMEKGSMRLEANTSLMNNKQKTINNKLPDYKVEMKNINSFKFMEKAIVYDFKRQAKLLDNDETPRQETRGWDEKNNRTLIQRYKETAADYRYFPEPDIPPIKLTNGQVNKLKGELPELPEKLKELLMKKFAIRESYADLLTQSRDLAEFSKKALEFANSKDVEVEKVAGYIINKKVKINKVKPQDIVERVKEESESVVDDTAKLEIWASDAIKISEKAVLDYKSGKTAAISAIIGKVMQLSKGKADAVKVKKILEKKLQ